MAAPVDARLSLELHMQQKMIGFLLSRVYETLYILSICCSRVELEDKVSEEKKRWLCALNRHAYGELEFRWSSFTIYQNSTVLNPLCNACSADIDKLIGDEAI